MVDGLTTVLRKANLSAGELKGVSFSAAMHSLILLDEDHKPLTRAITWPITGPLSTLMNYAKMALASRSMKRLGHQFTQ